MVWYTCLFLCMSYETKPFEKWVICYQFLSLLWCGNLVEKCRLCFPSIFIDMETLAKGKFIWNMQGLVNITECHRRFILTSKSCEWLKFAKYLFYVGKEILISSLIWLIFKEFSFKLKKTGNSHIYIHHHV